jgi:hypothetical protein
MRVVFYELCKRLYKCNESKIEEIARKKRYASLRWCPASPGSWEKEVGWILYGHPRNDPLDQTPIACSIEDGLLHTIGYKFIRKM